MVLGMIACKKERPTSEELHDLLSVTGPSTANVNTNVTFVVTYPYSNGCDYIGRFEETKNSNVISIKAFSKPVPKNTICTQDIGTRTIEYTFRSATAGAFELRFRSRDGSFVTHTITIQ